jgi:hypothetical protein
LGVAEWKGTNNMRVSTAYFAGVGTVVAAIVGGVGGGLLMADMIHPKNPKQGVETSRLERRMSPEPIQAAAAPSQPVQFLATPQLSAPATTVAAAPAPAQPREDAAKAVSTPAQPAATSAATQPVAHEPTAAPENALAKARETDVKLAAEKRKAERHQQWAEGRRQRQRQEPRVVVLEANEPKQEFAAEPVRIEMPRIRLFGAD